MRFISLDYLIIAQYNISILNKASKNILFRSTGLLLLSLLAFFLFSTPSFAAEISELEKYKGKEYGPEYFFAIQGEVYGQAAPGVQAVYVNNKRVQIGKDLIFRTKVNLKKGQKHLTIETRYKGLRFIKKYLVIRHPAAPKTFKIHVPKKEFQKIISKAKPAPKKKRKIVKKPKPKPKPKEAEDENWLGFELVAELEPEKMLVVRRINGKYFALIYHAKSKAWVPLHEISLKEFKDILEKNRLPPSFNS